MTPTPSPRHPWKALAVVLAALVVAHGAHAHIGSSDHGFTRAHIVDDSSSWQHCQSVDVDEDDHDEPDDDPVMDIADHDDDDDWN